VSRATEPLAATGRPARALPPSIPDLFEDRAARQPHAVAVVEPGGVVTYGELLERSRELAARLGALDLAPEACALLVVERSAAAIVALLGALRAGLVVVPVEPPVPEERLRLLLADCAAACVIVSDPRLAAVAAGFDGPIVDASRPAPPLASSESSAPSPRTARVPALSPARAACVLYTSGSTGRPKGAVLTHGCLAWYADEFSRLTGHAAEDRHYQFASLTFDASLSEILSALVVGARLILRPPGPIEPVAAMLGRLEREAVTVLHVPTAFWHHWMKELVADPNLRPPASLRLLIVGGEAATLEAMRTWSRTTRIAWLNTYGPTEVTISATAFPLAPGQLVDEAPPIGWPLPGVRAHVLDEELEPSAPGSAGELFLGGVGVGRGYLGSPRQTAERFVPDPFHPGERMYRTGDEVLRAPDGLLRFRRRLDLQVKLRGHRVELPEIEIALGALIPRAQVAVLLRTDPGRPAHLVAYLVLADGDQLDRDAVDVALAGRLPSYMLPAAYVVLDAFPLTERGKIDRARLPPPATPTPAARPTGALADPLQALLLGLVDEVLGRPVEVDEDLFQAGASSLDLIGLQGRLSSTLGVTLRFVDLFTNRTVEALARVVERAQLDSLDQARLDAVTRSIQDLSEEQAQALLAPDDP
jgi:amino acid adenylation domain-containing protein